MKRTEAAAETKYKKIFEESGALCVSCCQKNPDEGWSELFDFGSNQEVKGLYQSNFIAANVLRMQGTGAPV